MRVRQTLAPGRRGTRSLARKYGDRLACVRYRYDEATGKRCTTVELIVDEGAWRPYDAQDPVWVQVDWHEKQLRGEVKKHGGQWDPARKLWSLRYNAVVHLGLEDRIVAGAESQGVTRSRDPQI